MAIFIEDNGSALYIKRDEDGNILLCNKDGETIQGQYSVVVGNEVGEITSATVSLHLAGWVD